MNELLALGGQVLQAAMTLTVATLLFALSDRRLLMVPVALQYVLVASLMGPSVGLPLFGIRLTMGLSISAILYITATRMEKVLGQPIRPRAGNRSPRIALPQMGAGFRVLAYALAALLAVGLWNSYPLPAVPAALQLSAVWLLAVGGSIVLTSADPLRIGVGILVAINGFQAAYLMLETSLLIVALTGLVDLVITLAIAYASDRWIESTMGEVRGS